MDSMEKEMKQTIGGRHLILASASPRRLAIMHENGYAPEVIPADIEEQIPSFLTPEEAVMHLALSKALAVKKRLAARDTEEAAPLPASLIVGADTIVVSNRKILGKPEDKDDARKMLRDLSGITHQVLTGVAMAATDTDSTICFCEVTHVTFRDLPKQELEAYLDTNEPYDKAGGYGIQGTFSQYVEKTRGDINNVIGFPWQRFLFEAQRFPTA
jgi:septum formation protein